jgi:hypothetical protein
MYLTFAHTALFKYLIFFMIFKPKFRYVMLLGNTDSQIVQYPYYNLDKEFYDKLLGHAVIGVITYEGEKIIGIEQAPVLTHLSRYETRKELSQTQNLWRYVELFKLEDMLLNSKLYLTRIDRFKDNLEGVSPESCLEAIRLNNLDNGKLEEQIKLFSERTKRNRQNSFVCCWHVNDSLNPKMWDEYGGCANESIAIETTVENLKNCFVDKWLPVVFEKIRYFDEPLYNQETHWFPSLFKTRPFEFENEYRCAINIENQNNIEFVKARIRVSKLINKIYLHPKAEESFVKKVHHLVKTRGFEIPIIKAII